MQYADLHTHTTASDGTFTPEELVRAAHEKNIHYLAVTDHDTTAALPEAARLCGALDIRFLPGVELSTEGAPGKCHLLGLGIDMKNQRLNETLAYLADERRTRNERMSERLRTLGIDLTLEEVTAIAPPGANVGRPHFAQALVEKGVVASLSEAFDRYLGDNAAAYMKKEVLSPADAIDLIHGAGGLAFLAHPGLVRYAQHETYETRLTALKGIGLDGVEVYYPRHTPAVSEQFLRLADKLSLLVTGGSDFHGANKPDITLGGVGDDSAPLSADLLPPDLLARAG